MNRFIAVELNQNSLRWYLYILNDHLYEAAIFTYKPTTRRQDGMLLNFYTIFVQSYLPCDVDSKTTIKEARKHSTDG